MIDFHAHTTASDGVLSPSELVAEAADAGLTAIGVMDHDTAKGIPEAVTAAELREITLIPGVELTAYHNGKEWHILAMLIDAEPNHVAHRLKPFTEKRHSRMREMVEKLRKDGYDITPEEVEAEATGHIVGRMHLARILIAKGYASSNNQVYRKFIGNGKPYYVPKLTFTIKEAVEMSYDLGGVPVAAHPGIPGDDEALKDFVEAGIAGIEAYTPKHTKTQEKHYEKLGQSLGLIVTAGSDYHGQEKHVKNRIGSRTSPDEVLEVLREYKKTHITKARRE